MEQSFDYFFKKIRTMDFWIEWVATLLTLLGVYLTAFNYYPINIVIGFIGNALWAIMAIKWRKLSLFVVQIVIFYCIFGG